MSNDSAQTEWKLMRTGDGQALVKTFHFGSFAQTMQFVNAVADIAEKQNHHPTMLVQFQQCTLRYTTHDANNSVTDKDVDAVEAINALL